MSVVNGIIFLITGFLLVWYLNKYYTLRKEFFAQRNYFIKTLGHDLRVSAIAQIRGLNLLEKNPEDENIKAELIKEVNSSCKYSLEMITMLLNSYKFDNGEQVLYYEYFNLNDSIKACSSKLLEVLKEKSLEIIFFNDAKILIMADRNAIERLLELLFSTAISNSNINSKIRVLVLSNDNVLELKIMYQGKVLTEEESCRMLGKDALFSTVGHGIKMNFCRKIVEFHKGKLEFSSHDGINTFTVLIPVERKVDQSKPLCLTALQSKVL